MGDYRDVKKRLSALAVAGVLLFATYGSDFITIAEGENTCTNFVDENSWDAEGVLIVDDAGNSVPDGLCDNCGRDLASHLDTVAENTEEATEEEAVVEETTDSEASEENTTETQIIEETAEDITCAHADENADGICDLCGTDLNAEVSESDPAEEETETEIVDENTITVTETVVTEGDALCEHVYEYKDNGDGTHTASCTLCDRVVTSECTANEEGKCYFCGAEVKTEESEETEELEETEEELLADPATCEHEYEYTYNEDGTHSFTCPLCGDEGSEDCTLNDAGFCYYCGGYYEPADKSKETVLSYQTFSNTMAGVTVTVSGMLPDGCSVDIGATSPTFAENIINNSISGSNVDALGAYHINIYDKDGNEYQPCYDDNTVNISITGLRGYDADQIQVYRIEDDYTEVTPLDTNASADAIICETEHFTIISVASVSSEDSLEAQYIGYVGTTTNTYTRVRGTEFKIELTQGQSVSYKAYLYRDVTNVNTPKSGSSLVKETSSETITGTTAGSNWYTYSVDFVDSNTDAYMASGTTYAVILEFSGEVTLQCGSSTGYTSTTYTSSDGTTYNTGIGSTNDNVFSTAAYTSADGSGYLETDAAPSDITAIAITGTKSGTAIATENGSKYAVYQAGTTDSLVTTLTPNYTRNVVYKVTSGTSIELTNSSTGTFTTKSAGVSVVTVSYMKADGTTPYCTDSIEIYVVNLLLKASETDADPYSPTFTGAAITSSYVAVYDGTNTYTASANPTYVGTPTYTDNTNAGTATVAVPFKLNGKTYSLQRTFTIKPAEITWEANFASAQFTINSSTQVVTAVSDVVNAVANESLVLGTNYTATVESYSVATTSYTIKIEPIGSNYTVGTGCSGTYTVSASSLDINDYVKVTWNSGAVTDYEYTGGSIYESEFKNVANTSSQPWTFYYLNDTQATFITSTNTTITYDDKDNYSIGDHKIYFTIDGYDTSKPLSLTYTITQKSYSSTDANFQVGWMDASSNFSTTEPSFTHTGSEIKPVEGNEWDPYVYVSYKGNKLAYGTDYDVSFTGNEDIETATAKITFMGNFKGSKKLYFEIVPDFEKDAVVYVNSSKTPAQSSNSFISKYSQDYAITLAQPSITFNLGDTTLNLTSSDSSSDGYYVDSTEWSKQSADAGQKAMVLKGTGQYAGKSLTVYFTVSKINLSNTTAVKLTMNNTSFIYGGTARKLINGTDYNLVFTSKKTVSGVTSTETYNLTEGDTGDVKIVYPDSYTGAVGTYAFTIVGNDGNFTGNYPTNSCTFSITKKSLTSSDITVGFSSNSSSYTYTGSAIEPTIIVKDGSSVLEEGTDYTLAYSNNTNIGTGSISITGMGNYKDSITENFTITAKSVDSLAIYLNNNIATKVNGNYYCAGYNPTYTGKALTPSSLTIKDGDTSKTLSSPTDFTSAIYNNINASNYSDALANNKLADAAYIEITFLGNYAMGTPVKVYFDIAPIDLSKVTATIDSSVAWTGNPAYPTISLQNNNLSSKPVLVPDTDYTVAYSGSDYTTAGSGKPYTITGKGNYTGTIEGTYSIGTDINDVTLKLINPITGDAYAATGNTYSITYLGHDPSDSTKYMEPTVTISSGGITLTEDTQYTIERTSAKADIYNSYNGTNVVTVTVKGINGYYNGSDGATYKTITYTIKPIDFSKTMDKVGESLADGTTALFIEATGSSAVSGSKLTYYYNPNGLTIKDNVSITFEYKVGTDNYDVYDTLVYGTDYTSEGTFGPDVSVSKVKLSAITSGVGNYSGSVTGSFTIVARPLGQISGLSDTSITPKVGNTFFYDSSNGNALSVYYTGKAITFTDDDFTVKVAGKTLSLGSEYFAYCDSKDQGTGKVYLYCTSDSYPNYASAYSAGYAISFQIVQVGMNSGKVSATVLGTHPYKSAAYNQDTDFEMKVVYDGTELIKNTDYEIIGYGTNTYPGQGTRGASAQRSDNGNYVKIQGIGGKFQGTLDVPFTITLDLSSSYANVTMDNTNYYLVGNTPEPIISYTYGATTYTVSKATSDGTNYAVSVANVGTPGVQTVTITGSSDGSYIADTVANGKYSVVSGTYTTTAKFLIDLSSLTTLSDIQKYVRFKNDVDTYAFTGSSIDLVDGETYKLAQTVIVNYGTRDTDYKVSCSGDLTAVGTKYVVLTGRDGGSYFVPNSSCKLPYYVKYEITESNTYLCFKGNKASSTAYTGDTFTIDDGVVASPDITIWGVFGTGSNKKEIAISKAGGTAYVKLSCNATIMTSGKYTISVVPDLTNYGNQIMIGSDTTITKVFEVTGKTFDTNITLTMPVNDSGNTIEYTYTGSAICPYPTVVDSSNSRTLTLDTDYSIRWETNTDAGEMTAKIIVTGKGAYDDNSITQKFTIKKKNVADTDEPLTFDISETTYGGDGVAVSPTIEVSYNGLTLVEGTDYTITTGSKVLYASAENTTDGVYTLDFNSSTNFKGTKSGTFKINKYNIASSNLLKVKTDTEFINAEITHDMIAKELILAIPDGTEDGVALKPDADYTFKITDSTGKTIDVAQNVDTYNIIVTGKNNCEGECTIQFNVTKRSIPTNWAPNGTDASSNIHIDDLSIEKFTDGVAVEPTAEQFKIYDTGRTESSYTLVAGTDYEIVGYGTNTHAAGAEYSTSKDEMDEYGNYLPTADSPYVIIQGLGNYESEPFKVAFSIGKNINTVVWGLSNVKVDLGVTSYTYNGKEQIPTPTITYTNGDKGTSYFTSFTTSVVDVKSVDDKIVETPDDAVSAGTKRLIITGTGDYYGTLKNNYQTTGDNAYYFTYVIYTRDISSGYSLKGSTTSDYVVEGTPDKAVSVDTLNSSLTFKLDLDVMDDSVISGLSNGSDYEDYKGYYYFTYDGESYDAESGTLVQKTPSITVYDNGLACSNKIVDPENYEVTYHNADAASVTSGNYLGYAEVTMTNNYKVHNPKVVFKVYYLIVANNIKASGFNVLLTDGTTQFPWTGSAVKPLFTVKNSYGTVLSSDEYKVTYSDDLISPGKKTMTVTGQGNYAGTITKDYYVKADIADCTVVVPKTNTTFDANDATTYTEVGADGDIGVQLYMGEGVEIKPNIQVILKNGAGVNENLLLVEDEDYSYTTSSDDKYTKTGKVTLTGLGLSVEDSPASEDETVDETTKKQATTKFYAGSREDLTFTIKLDPTLITVAGYETSYTYTSLEIQPDLYLESTSGVKLDSEYVPFTTTYERKNSSGSWETTTDFINVGTIRATITFDLENTETQKKYVTYTITPRDLTGDDMHYIYLKKATYTGERIEPFVSFYFTTEDGDVVYMSDRDTINELFDLNYSITGAENTYPQLTNQSDGSLIGDQTGEGRFTISAASTNSNYTGTKTLPFAITLGAPTSISAPADANNSVKLSWTKNKYATGTIAYCYEVLSDNTTKLIEKATVSTNTYTFDNLKETTTYKFALQSYLNLDTDNNGVNETYYSTIATRTTRTSTTGAKLELTSPSSGTLSLTWVDGGNTVQYRIYRSTDNVTFKKVASLPASTNGYTDASLATGKTYYYYVEGWVIENGVFVKDTKSDTVSYTFK